MQRWETELLLPWEGEYGLALQPGLETLIFTLPPGGKLQGDTIRMQEVPSRRIYTRTSRYSKILADTAGVQQNTNGHLRGKGGCVPTQPGSGRLHLTSKLPTFQNNSDLQSPEKEKNALKSAVE